MIDIETLKDNELFENFSDEELDLFLRSAVELELRPDEILFHEGDLGTEMYIVENGDIEIYKELGVDEPKLLVSLPAGTFLGEMSLIDGAPRSAMVKSTKENSVKLIVFSRGYIESMTVQHNNIVCKFIHNIIKISAGRSRLTMERLIQSKQTLENVE